MKQYGFSKGYENPVSYDRTKWQKLALIGFSLPDKMKKKMMHSSKNTQANIIDLNTESIIMLLNTTYTFRIKT